MTENKAKNPVGRPRKYKSVEQMQAAIDVYFHYIKEIEGKISICGLALHLGFISRQSFLDYSGYGKEYSDTIKKAKTRVEEYYETHLTEPNAGGSIFALKNFGWKDNRDITSDGKPITPQIVVFGTPTKANDDTEQTIH